MDRRGWLRVFELELFCLRLVGGQTARTWVRRVFFSSWTRDVSIRIVKGFIARDLWTVCTVRVAHGPSKGRVRTVRFSKGAYWRFGALLRTIRPNLWTILLAHANCSPSHLRPSAQGFADCLSHLPLELRFRLGFVWDLFLGLVGPVWLRDLGKLVWDFLVVNLGNRQSSSFEKNFYRLSFTPHPLWSPNRSFSCGHLWRRWRKPHYG
jgi:hypothetical protein